MLVIFIVGAEQQSPYIETVIGFQPAIELTTNDLASGRYRF